MTDNTDNSVPDQRRITLTKILKDDVDVRDYEIVDHGSQRKKVIIESDDMGVKHTLCTLDCRTNKLVEMDLTRNAKITVPQLVERLKIIDEAMREVGMVGFIDDNPLDEVESRLEELEKTVNGK